MSYKSPLSIRDKLEKKEPYIGEYMPIHHPIATCFPCLHQPHDRPFYCNNILMFSVKLVLVCDEVLIQSWNLCENGYWDNLY